MVSLTLLKHWTSVQIQSGTSWSRLTYIRMESIIKINVIYDIVSILLVCTVCVDAGHELHCETFVQ